MMMMNVRERRRDKKRTQPGEGRRGTRAVSSSTLHLPHALVVPHPGAVSRVWGAEKIRGAKLHRYGKSRPSDYRGGINDHFYFTSELCAGCEHAS